MIQIVSPNRGYLSLKIYPITKVAKEKTYGMGVCFYIPGLMMHEICQPRDRALLPFRLERKDIAKGLPEGLDRSD